MILRSLFIFAATCVAANTFATGQPAPAPTDSPQPMEGIEFADECHVKISDSNQSSPVIAMLVAAHSMQPKNQAAIRVAIDTSLRQGCDISEVDLGGLQPLNAAILFADPVMVKFLLEKGADPYQTIQRPDSKSIDGLNSFDFIEIVKKKREERGEAELLKQYEQIEKYLNQRR